MTAGELGSNVSSIYQRIIYAQQSGLGAYNQQAYYPYTSLVVTKLREIDKLREEIEIWHGNILEK